ncbi:hypothetical protein SH2C18_07080 [Clostridium sediminicola]|uniref:putative ABC transporter permease subunit n=1 Tax=Clostridium sediminicola TaxID=3114879 RepID=UPI0031F23243
MRELIGLTKVHLNSSFGFSDMKYKIFKQKKDLWKPILFVFVIASLMPAYMLFLIAVDNVYFGLKMINQTNSLITIAFSSASMVILIFSLVYVMSVYYFSKDINILLPMPLKPKNIILSKFIGMVLTQYLFTLPFLIPIIVTYGINEGKGLVFIIFATISLLVVPIAPLGISTIIIILIMKVTNIKGKKDLIRTISMFIMLGIIIGIQMLISKETSKIPMGEEQLYLAELLENNMGLVNTIGATFPLSIIVTKALILDGIWSFINIILYIVISIAILGTTLFVGEKIYLGGIIGGEESSSGNKKLTANDLEAKLQKKSHPFIAVFKLDFKLLLRTPAYLFNCVSTVIIIPLILIIMPVTTDSSAIGELTKYYGEFYRIIDFAIVAFFLLLATINPTAATTFSREGKHFWINRLAPVKPIDQIKGRMLTSIFIQIFGILFVLIGISFFVQIKMETIFICIFFGILGSLPLYAIGILIDLIRPVLNWDNPQKAVKQNMNVLVFMLVGIVYTAVLGVLVIFLLKLLKSITLIYFIFTIIFISITVVLIVILNSIFAEKFVDI